MLSDILRKKDVTILITDSGLGGLSVAADVVDKLNSSCIFESAKVIFCNAAFDRRGYNALSSEAEKARIFNIMLQAVSEKYHPDLLLIACNTLSIVYAETAFTKTAPFPVVGIVETGVDLIAKEFDKNPQAIAIIFGTMTTIESGSHRDLLIKRGYRPGQIVGQACHTLAGKIERGYDSTETVGLLRKCVSEALGRIGNSNSPIFASLNCTHYGYVLPQFRAAFADRGYPDIEIINPNPQMANCLFESFNLNRHSVAGRPTTPISIQVVSKMAIDQEIQSLSSLIEKTCVQVAEASRNYLLLPDLFDPGGESRSQ